MKVKTYKPVNISKAANKIKQKYHSKIAQTKKTIQAEKKQKKQVAKAISKEKHIIKAELHQLPVKAKKLTIKNMTNKLNKVV